MVDTTDGPVPAMVMEALPLGSFHPQYDQTPGNQSVVCYS